MEIIRESWNKVMPLHQIVTKELYDNLFLRKDASVLRKADQEYLVKNIGVPGISVAQLCCNNGVELMSLSNLGAKDLTGFDICDEAIFEAKERCKKLNYQIEFIRTDINDIMPEYENRYDLVFISAGSIRWLPSLARFYEICNKLLKPNGSLYISEIHPIAEIINDDRDISKSPLEIIISFDRKECMHDFGSLDYIGHSNDLLVERIWYVHPLSDIIGQLISYKFCIRYFRESIDDIANVYSRTSSTSIRVPLSFQLEAKKEV